MRRLMRLPAVFFACTFACAAASLAATPPAFAQGKKPPAGKNDPKLAEAKKLFDDGAAAYAQGNYEEAIRAWEKSYELSQKPLIFESIANAWERLGDAKKARDNLARWRDSAPAEERDLLDARIKNLDARVAREQEAAKRAAADKADREAREKAQAEAQKQKPWLAGAIVTAVGGAAVIAGVTVDLIANGKRPGADACKAVGAQTICRSSAEGAIATSNRMAIAGDITWIAGAAAAAAGVVLIVVKTKQAQKDQAPPVSAWITPAPGGLILSGRF